jgi:hypothetical protein
MIFKHIVGKSTFKYGFTIPKKIYNYLEIPEKGEKREIQLLYGKNQKSAVWLCRLNNAVGHLQVRYEGKCGESFKKWLKEIFVKSWENNESNFNEYFEVIISNNNNLLIKEYPLNNKFLCLENIIVHKINEATLFSDEKFIEIIESIRTVEFHETERQMFYNTEIKKELAKKDWLTEQRVVEDKKIGLKCDFRKDNFQLEVEFGNARTYYQDIVKFVMSYNVGLIKIGGLLVPSAKLARHLCELGRFNAIQKSKGKRSSYSGMMDFNKATVEFRYIKDVFNIPFFIMSISYAY